MGHEDCVRLLLRAGAKVAFRNKHITQIWISAVCPACRFKIFKSRLILPALMAQLHCSRLAIRSDQLFIVPIIITGAIIITIIIMAQLFCNRAVQNLP